MGEGGVSDPKGSGRAAGTPTGAQLLLPVFLLVVGGVAYSAIPSLTRLATTSGVPPISYVFWQILGGGLLVFLLTFTRRNRPKLVWAHMRFYLTVGPVGMGLPYCIMAFAAPKIPAGIIALGLALVPMLTYGIMLMLRMEGHRWWRTVGLALGLIGVLFIVLPEASLPSPEMAGWALVGLSPAILFAISLVAGQRFMPPDGDPLALAAGALFVIALFLLPVMIFAEGLWFFDGSFGWGNGAVIISMIIIAITWYVLVVAIRLVGAVIYSTIAYIESLVGVGWGMLIFGERHSLWIWAAVVLLMLGLYLVNRPAR
jgi:drug/metabolite transporter (DMT)-like permease